MGRDRDEGRPVDPEEAGTAGYDPDAVEVHRRGDSGYDERRQRAGGLGPDIPASGPAGAEERSRGTVGPGVAGGSVAGSVAEGRTGQHITREDIRRAARDGMVDREEELKGDGLYGSSTSDPILPAALAELVGTFILVFGGTAVGVGDLQAFVLEILITFVLVFVVVSVATDSRAPATIAPIAVGFALAVGVFIAGPVTGGAVNPVRALGPMLVAGDLTSVWLYLLGPIIGGVLGGVVYEKTMAPH